jgi:hypothetical protein
MAVRGVWVVRVVAWVGVRLFGLLMVRGVFWGMDNLVLSCFCLNLWGTWGFLKGLLVQNCRYII